MKRLLLIPALASSLGLFLELAAPPGALALEASPRALVSDTSRDGRMPRVAVGKDGGFAILWLRDVDGSLAVRAFSPSGAPAGPQHTVATEFAQIQAFDLAALPGGGFVAVWNEVSIDDGLFSTLARLQLLAPSGAPAEAPSVLRDTRMFEPFEATVDAAGVLTLVEDEGGFIFAWRHTLEGLPLGSKMTLATDLDFEIDTSAVALPGGGFALVRNHENGTLPVTLRRLGPDGTAAGPEVVVHADRPAARTGARISASASGHLVVAWKESGSPPRNVARVFSRDGEPLSPEIAIADSTGGKASFVEDVEARADGSFLVQWSHGRELRAGAFALDGRRIGFDLTLDDRIVTPGGADADAAAAPGGWISAWAVDVELLSAPGPWFSALTPRCNDAAGPGLCLNGSRFRATVDWHVPATGARGAGQPIPLTGDTGAFWFFQPGNYELTVKVLDGRGTNGRFWVFYGSLTDVGFDLTVTDTLTGAVRTYHNPAGTMASRADTTAF